MPVFKPHFLHWLCMCECGVHTHQSEHVWRSEDSARESLLFYHVGPWIELGPSGSVLSIFMRSNLRFLGICLFSLVENHLENVCCLSFGWCQCLALWSHMENPRQWVEFTSHCWMPLSLGGSWFPLLNSLVWVSRLAKWLLCPPLQEGLLESGGQFHTGSFFSFGAEMGTALKPLPEGH